MLKTEAISRFLKQTGYPIAALYTPEMEVQVNVAKDNGEIIEGEYSGHKWQGFTDGLTTWKHFRIPWKANTEPEYKDEHIKFDIAIHAEAIGMTGWDWQNKRSRWVAYDFDSIIGHKQGLTQDEIQEIIDRLSRVDWCTLYSSTSGSGIHVYIFLSAVDDIPTHSHHTAVARAILGKLSALAGIPLESKVDTLGGNMWVWHRKATPGKSFEVLKQGTSLDTIPPNWRDYITVRRTPKPTTEEDMLLASHRQINLDKEHLALLEWFERSDALWWWNDEKYILVCHTYDLKRAHDELHFRGIFSTVSTGRETGRDQNCFAIPRTGGSWVIRRHGKGTTESDTWFTSDTGWTTCYYNELPTLALASRTNKGTVGDKCYTFQHLSQAINALNTLEIECTVPQGYEHRAATINYTLEGKITIQFEAGENDRLPLDSGWNKVKKHWVQVFHKPQVIGETELPDHLVRHIIANEAELGWYVNTQTSWVNQSRTNIISVLKSYGYRIHEIDNLLGQCIVNHWELASLPFQPEYPGDRKWNKYAPQFRFNPQKGNHPTWDLLLEHIGRNLEDATREHTWCSKYGILTGNNYLSTWVSNLIRFPMQPLPYLTLTGPQNCGKSILHEALSCLFTRGVIRADNALTNPSGFNGEITGAILCVVEETNLSKRGYASDRIKDWVTGRTISIHQKHKQPYDIPNYTHWIQCTNDLSYCPVLPGDTRITVIKIDSLPPEREIPKPQLLEQCEEEAPAFLHTLLNLKLPEPIGRLRMPVLETKIKEAQQEANKSSVEIFVDEEMEAGRQVLYADVFNRFIAWLGQSPEKDQWTNRRFARELRRLDIELDRKGAGGSMYVVGKVLKE